MHILYQDDFCFAIDKPVGHFVHPPERSPFPPPPEKICLYVLRDLFGQSVFPVHRLDAPTSGVMLWAFDRDATRALSELFMNREVQKIYRAVVRGFVDEEGVIDLPLESKGQLAESVTRYRRLAQVELPFAVGKKYPSARYSLIEVEPQTGRWHQIRRHFDRISHPLLGDIEHGDSHHNSFFRDQLGLSGLCLRAMRLEFRHPWTQQELRIEAGACKRWQKIESIFQTPTEVLGGVATSC